MAIGGISLLSSCEDYGQSDSQIITGINTEDNFKGNVIDYLSSPHDDGLKFDSLLYILDRIPELKAELLKRDKEITFFAPTDDSFKEAIRVLNSYRKSNNIGNPVYLKDLLIEPFSVQDTTIVVNRLTQEEDTTFTDREFDYCGQLDLLLSRYCFNGSIKSDYVIETGGSVKQNVSRNNIEMVIEAGRYDASGAVGTGIKYLYLVETNGSNMQSSWVKAEALKQDIKVDNGTIHVLTVNHEFGFNLFTPNFKNRGTEKGVKVVL